ncbi:MAG: CinA family protein [Oligoflexales bacterium]
MDRELTEISKKIVTILTENKKSISTAESCTGGLISTYLTEVPGSSACFNGGVCSYTEFAKGALLGIPQIQIDKFGVVSKEVAIKMANSVQMVLQSDYGLSTTGVAGPGGGSAKTPVGTVWCGIATPKSCEAFCLHLEGNRNMIRKGAVTKILTHLYTEHLKEQI